MRAVPYFRRSPYDRLQSVECLPENRATRLRKSFRIVSAFTEKHSGYKGRSGEVYRCRISPDEVHRARGRQWSGYCLSRGWPERVAAGRNGVGSGADGGRRCGAVCWILGEIGIVPLAVTTSLTINFLRKPVASKSIIGVCELMKVGKSLAVGEVSLYSEGMREPVAHVVGTYSIPPR